MALGLAVVWVIKPMMLIGRANEPECADYLLAVLCPSAALAGSMCRSCGAPLQMEDFVSIPDAD
jgi:hypothetical protein